MSMDYPFYEEMVRRGSRGRWFWRIGDWLYYIGIFVFMFGIPAAALLKIGTLKIGLVGVSGIVIFVCGVVLKNISYWIAKREGMDFHER